MSAFDACTNGLYDRFGAVGSTGRRIRIISLYGTAEVGPIAVRQLPRSERPVGRPSLDLRYFLAEITAWATSTKPRPAGRRHIHLGFVARSSSTGRMLATPKALMK